MFFLNRIHLKCFDRLATFCIWVGRRSTKRARTSFRDTYEAFLLSSFIWFVCFQLECCGWEGVKEFAGTSEPIDDSCYEKVTPTLSGIVARWDVGECDDHRWSQMMRNCDDTLFVRLGNERGEGGADVGNHRAVEITITQSAFPVLWLVPWSQCSVLIGCFGISSCVWAGRDDGHDSMTLE